MTEAQAIKAIILHWQTAWSARRSDVPWITGNEVADSAASYVRITVIPSVSVPGTLGPRVRRHRRGNIAVQCFTLPNAGDDAIATLADDVRACLEGRVITLSGADEPVYVFDGSSNGKITDGAWNMQTVVLPYEHDETR